MLAGVCVVPVVLVRVAVALCSVDGVRPGGEGRGPDVGLLQGALWLVEQQFAEVGLVCPG